MKILEYPKDIAEMDYWTAEQAAYYSCGLEPSDVDTATKHGDVDGVMARNVGGGFKYELQHGLTRRETPRGVS